MSTTEGEVASANAVAWASERSDVHLAVRGSCAPMPPAIPHLPTGADRYGDASTSASAGIGAAPLPPTGVEHLTEAAGSSGLPVDVHDTSRLYASMAAAVGSTPTMKG